METQKPKSIKNVGLTIAILSSLVVFSNGMSALMFTLLGFNNYENNEAQDLTNLDSFFNNIQYFLLLLVAIGILFLIGGIQLMKYKIWAKKLLLTLSIVLISAFTLILILAIHSAYVDNDALFALIPIAFIWLAFTLPLFFLIRFLNKETIQKHLN
jgi:magnesium-transporting ATPase (P-type)